MPIAAARRAPGHAEVVDGDRDLIRELVGLAGTVTADVDDRLAEGSNSGRASTSAPSPPTMMDRRASTAPISRPTPARRNLKPFASARSATSAPRRGEAAHVDGSADLVRPSAIPSGPNVTVSTSGAFVTIVTTMSDRRATLRGDTTGPLRSGGPRDPACGS
jgi:hypothetical protein